MTFMTLFGFGMLGQPLKSYSIMVVIMGNFGQGKAQPIIHIIGSSTTCKLRATKNA